MKSYTGTCHCGDVEFEFDVDAEEITDGLRRNCSICKRLACVHSMKVDPKGLRLTKDEDKIHTYTWGDLEIPFTFCKNCGVYVYYNTDYQCRVNMGCVDEVDTFNLTTHFFDGKHEL